MTSIDDNRIPDRFQERGATEDAERAIRRAGGDYMSLLDEEAHAEQMVSYTVMVGDDLANARQYAMVAALVRDARLTGPELHIRADT